MTLTWAEQYVMWTLGWANYKTDMKSRDLGDACHTLLKPQGFDVHKMYGIYMLFLQF